MGKPKKSRKNKFNYNKDRRKAWKKSKKLPSIPCEPIKKAWDETKSAAQNLQDMGLSANPNKTLSIRKTKVQTQAAALHTDEKQTNFKATKSHVAEELESQANQPVESTMKLSEPIVQFCVYMMNRYGEDYKAMARDPKNYYQDTPKQIRRKILTFQNTPTQYNAYLASLEGCVTPSTRVQDGTRERIVPRRRVPTRGFEAASRNGHFRSLSPVPSASTISKKADDSLLAALVRVRRRLKFGRKPPKERCSVHGSSAIQEAKVATPLRNNEAEAPASAARMGVSLGTCDDEGTRHPPERGSPKGRSVEPHHPKPRRKLTMVDTESRNKLDRPQSQRET